MHTKGSFIFKLTAGPIYVASINLRATMIMFFLGAHGEKNTSQKVATASDGNTFDFTRDVQRNIPLHYNNS